MPVIPRTRLHGKRVTEEEMLQEISSLLSGNSGRPYPLVPSEIARTLGVSRQTVYNYIGKLTKQKILQKNSSGRFILPKNNDSEFHYFNSHHPITNHPLISEWMDDLLTRTQGSPVKSWRQRIRSVEIVCNTCKVSPKDLLVSQKNTEKIMRRFAKLYQNGLADQSKKGKKPQGLNTMVYFRVQGVRDFCSFYGITWRRGIGGIMSQKVPGHGKYADIRFTKAEFEKADQYIQEQWGLDSDIYRWFWIGIESCARFNALYLMSNQYTKHQTDNKTIYVMTAYETKTQHIRGGKWSKYITKSDTQKSIDLIRSRGIDKIYESNMSMQQFQKDINQKLLQIYKHLGKNDDYYCDHPTHALRHLGAHYWLSKTDYNYGIISEVGGWNTIDELKKSYGQIPPEKILEVIN